MVDFCRINFFLFSVSFFFLLFNPSTNLASHFEKEFEIEFKNIHLKCRMEFDNSCPKGTNLIILTMSRRDGFEKRKGIRETWMRDSVSGEVIRFLIADPSPEEAKNVQQKLEEEQKKHGDLVFLHGFNDTYSHIHLKWYGGLQWQQSFCADAEWVMKADDDSIVHLQLLAHWTEKKFSQIAQQNPLVYFGHVFYNSEPNRDPNLQMVYVPENVYPADEYPNYMSGPVYLTTSATISAILSHSPEIVGFYLDDVVFTGILAKLANVTLSNQESHFIWNLQYEKYGECVDGVPTAFSIWGVGTVKDFEYHYERLKSVKC